LAFAAYNFDLCKGKIKKKIKRTSTGNMCISFF